MANIYCLFATEFAFPEQAAEDFISLCDGELDDFPQWFVEHHKLTEENFDRFLEDCEKYGGADITASYGGGKLYIASDDSGNINFVAFMLSEVMQYYNLREPVIIEYAFTCSKPRPGEFGGGVVVIGPGTWQLNSTAAIGEKMAKAMKKELNKK